MTAGGLISKSADRQARGRRSGPKRDHRDPVAAALAQAKSLLNEGREREACELLEKVSEALLSKGLAARYDRLERKLGAVGTIGP